MSAHVTASPRAQEQISEGPIKMENEIIIKKKKKRKYCLFQSPAASLNCFRIQIITMKTLPVPQETLPVCEAVWAALSVYSVWSEINDR